MPASSPLTVALGHQANPDLDPPPMSGIDSGKDPDPPAGHFARYQRKQLALWLV